MVKQREICDRNLNKEQNIFLQKIAMKELLRTYSSFYDIV